MVLRNRHGLYVFFNNYDLYTFSRNYLILYQKIRTSIKSSDYHQNRSSFNGKFGTRGISSGVEESCYEELFRIVGIAFILMLKRLNNRNSSSNLFGHVCFHYTHLERNCFILIDYLCPVIHQRIQSQASIKR